MVWGVRWRLVVVWKCDVESRYVRVYEVCVKCVPRCVCVCNCKQVIVCAWGVSDQSVYKSFEIEGLAWWCWCWWCREF